jgi:hypothetical protein
VARDRIDQQYVARTREPGNMWWPGTGEISNMWPGLESNVILYVVAGKDGRALCGQ